MQVKGLEYAIFNAHHYLQNFSYEIYLYYYRE
jgi:hypothetical protein